MMLDASDFDCPLHMVKQSSQFAYLRITFAGVGIPLSHVPPDSSPSAYIYLRLASG
jgi:hypothetical protein